MAVEIPHATPAFAKATARQAAAIAEATAGRPTCAQTTARQARRQASALAWLVLPASFVRRLILLVILSCAGLPATGKCADWFTDAQAAQEKAKQENKFVLLDFTGSDWCGWCMKLRREVFDQPEFADFAQANLVLVEVDFPHHKVLAPDQKQANSGLAGKYHITGYPTIILLDPDGHLAGRTGYMPGGPAAFDAKLAEVVKPGNKSPSVAPQSDPEKPRKPVAWVPIPPAAPVYYGSLALKGISGSKDRRMVMINNANLMVGETAKVKVQDREIVVCCKEIRDDSVVVTADGNSLELKLGQR
jgi:thioredoxin-related protein